MLDKILALIARLEVLIYACSRKNGNAMPASMIRPMLNTAFCFTEAECLEAFGVKSKRQLSKTAQRAIAVAARIHKGIDNYQVIVAKAEKLTKVLHTRLAELIEAQAREQAVAELKALDPERSIPSHFAASDIKLVAAALRKELCEASVHLLHEVDSLHRRLGRKPIVCDDPRKLHGEELVAVHERLASLHAEADEVFAAQEALRKPLRDACVALQNEIHEVEKQLGTKHHQMALLPKGFNSMDEVKLAELQTSYRRIGLKRKHELQQKELKERHNRMRRFGYTPPAKRAAS